MINPKNKRVQVTLPGETVELLESLSNRYNKTTTELVKWAINVLAAKKHHNIIIKLSEKEETEQKNQEKQKTENQEEEQKNKIQEETTEDPGEEILDFFEGR